MFTLTLFVLAVLPVVFLAGLALGAVAGRRSEAVGRRRLVAAALEEHGLSDAYRIVQPASCGGFELDNTVAPARLRLVRTR